MWRNHWKNVTKATWSSGVSDAWICRPSVRHEVDIQKSWLLIFMICKLFEYSLLLDLHSLHSILFKLCYSFRFWWGSLSISYRGRGRIWWLWSLVAYKVRLSSMQVHLTHGSSILPNLICKTTQQNSYSISHLLGTMTTQWLVLDQLCCHRAASSCQQWLHLHCPVTVPSRCLMELGVLLCWKHYWQLSQSV